MPKHLFAASSNRRLIAYVFIGIVAANVALVLLYAAWRGWSSGMVAIRPLRTRLALIKTLRRESITTSIENLPNFDDTVLVRGQAMGETAYDSNSYIYANQVVSKLSRARKIIDEVRNGHDRETVGKQLIDYLIRDTTGFDAVFQSKNRQIATTKGGVLLSAPDEYWIRTSRAPAIVYILGQLDFVDALPVLEELYSNRERMPVNRLFIFFVMHQLVSNFPESNLRSESVELRNRYYEVAGKLPAAKEVSVAAWDAQLAEYDLRFRVLGREFQHPCAFKLRQYPWTLTEYEDPDGNVDQRITQMYSAMQAFLKSLQ